MLKSLDVVYCTMVFNMTAVKLIWQISDGFAWENIEPLKLMDYDYTYMYSSHYLTSKYVYFHFRFHENLQKVAIFVKIHFFNTPQIKKRNGQAFGHVNLPSDLVIFLLQNTVLEIPDKTWRRRWLVKHKKSFQHHLGVFNWVWNVFKWKISNFFYQQL